ncbi:hypothetical protein FWG76_02695, partial [Candidatus Saccharibacteria bacterium]|nr:hypothetical protein [Candidatus Saccharibacteria bacterium]
MTQDNTSEPTAELASKGGATRVIRRVAAATLATSAFALLVGGIAGSFRQTTAQEIQIGAIVGVGGVSITDGPCSVANTSDQTNYDATNKKLDIAVRPGATASNCLGITAATDSDNGYTLTIAGPSSGNLTLANQAITPTSGSMTAPATFAAQNGSGAWGFAIPNGQISGFNFGFDANYSIVSSTNTAAALVGSYAPVPTSATQFSQTTAPATNAYDIFFGVSAGTNAATGTYTGVVTISGVGNGAAMAPCANAVTGFATGCTDQNIAVDLPRG